MRAPSSDNEFSLIQELARKPHQTQRELSKSTGLSLGMTNILLKRLAHKGFVKIRQLDWKRTHYLLTVKGLLEKTRKSCAYALYAYQQFQAVKKGIREIIAREHAQGLRKALVVAWPETVEMIQACLREEPLDGLALEYTDAFKHARGRAGVVFAATVEPHPPAEPGQRFVPLLDGEMLAFRFPDPTRGRP